MDQKPETQTAVHIEALVAVHKNENPAPQFAE